LSRSVVLQEVHADIVTSLGFDPDTAKLETGDTGAFSNELALLSQRYGADDLASHYFRQAIDRVRAIKAPFELANRLAGLRTVLANTGKPEEAGRIADEIAGLLLSPDLPERGSLVAHKALATHLRLSDRSKAISHLRAACEVADRLRLAIPTGSARAEVDRQFPDLPYTLAELLREEGRDTEALEALQRAKGRRVIETLAARPGDRDAWALPPTLAEVNSLLGMFSEPEPTVLIELATVSDGLSAFVADGLTVRAVHVKGDNAPLGAMERGDVREREARIVSLCLNDPLLCALAEAVCSVVPAGRRALVVPDRYLLNNLPIHAVPVQGRPWGDRMPRCSRRRGLGWESSRRRR
jgi:hypothetical protein